MLKKLIQESAAAMGIAMSETQAEQFEIYHEMLVEANARMNLTRVPDDPREAADRNYLDCVAPLAGAFPPEGATPRRAVDVGSGVAVGAGVLLGRWVSSGVVRGAGVGDPVGPGVRVGRGVTVTPSSSSS